MALLHSGAKCHKNTGTPASLAYRPALRLSEPSNPWKRNLLLFLASQVLRTLPGQFPRTRIFRYSGADCLLWIRPSAAFSNFWTRSLWLSWHLVVWRSSPQSCWRTVHGLFLLSRLLWWGSNIPAHSRYVLMFCTGSDNSTDRFLTSQWLPDLSCFPPEASNFP